MENSFIFFLRNILVVNVFCLIIVCFDVKLYAVENSVSWSIGSCFSELFQLNHLNTDRCCLPPGEYVLTCECNASPYDWRWGFVEIQGRKYCHGFVGFKTLQKIKIGGERSNRLHLR